MENGSGAGMPHKLGEGIREISLMKEAGLEVKKLIFSVSAEELLHHHKATRQFLYVLRGTGICEANGVVNILREEQHLLLEPGTVHKIMNTGDHNFELLLCSQPPVENDTFNLA